VPPFHDLCPETQLDEPGLHAFEVGGRELVVCRVEGEVHALAGRCTHAAWPLAGEPLAGCEIVCTLHGARFDVRDGTPTGGPAGRPLARYAVRCIDGRVEVELPA